MGSFLGASRYIAEDGDLPVKHVEELPVLVGEPRHGGGDVELDNEPPAGLARRVLGLVEAIGGDANDVEGPYLVGYALDKVDGLGA